MKFETSEKKEHGDDLEIGEVKLDVSEQPRFADRNLESDNGPVPLEIKDEGFHKQRMEDVRAKLASGVDFVPVPTVDTAVQKVTFEHPGQKSGDKAVSSGFGKKLRKYATMALVALGIASAGELKAEDGSSVSNQPKGSVWGNYFKNLEVKKAFEKNNQSGLRSRSSLRDNNKGKTIVGYSSQTFGPGYSGGNIPRGMVGQNYGGGEPRLEGLEEFIKDKVPGVVITHPGSYRGANQGVEVRQFRSDQAHTFQAEIPGSNVSKKYRSTQRNSSTSRRVR